MKDWHKLRPELFKKQPYYLTGCDSYLIRLGDPEAGKGLMAEVYTFPSGQMESSTEVFLMAEAEITSANCGKELSAQSLQVNRNGGLNALDLTMVMPDCDAVGDFLILQNMFEDLTIALR
jgi:hypothetical protein